MASVLYPLLKERLLDPNKTGGGGVGVDFNTDSLKAVLLTSGYTYSSAHDFLDDLTVASNSPTSGGTSAIASPTVALGVFDAADTVFTSVTTGFTITQIAVYKDTGTPSTSALICLFDGLSQATNGGSLTAVWHASGLFSL